MFGFEDYWKLNVRTCSTQCTVHSNDSSMTVLVMCCTVISLWYIAFVGNVSICQNKMYMPLLNQSVTDVFVALVGVMTR